jgi:uncharacterized protein YbjT (DUF2867 family)
MNKKALVIGATGLTGTECLNLLLNDEYYSGVEIWTRRSIGITHPKLIEKIIDFDKINQQENMKADHVFCCLGTTINKAKSQENFYKIDHDYVLACAKVAERSQAGKFLYISSIGANIASGNFYLCTKGQVEESLSQLIIPSVVIFRPSMLLGNRKEFRLGERIGKGVMSVFQFLMIGSLRKYRGVQASQVANAMIAEAKSTENGGFRIIESDVIQKY